MKARATKAREGAAGMHEITQALLNAAISADTRQRLPVAVAYVRESLKRQDGDAYARSCEALAGAQAAAEDRIEALSGESIAGMPSDMSQFTTEEIRVCVESSARRAANTSWRRQSARVCFRPASMRSAGRSAEPNWPGVGSGLFQRRRA